MSEQSSYTTEPTKISSIEEVKKLESDKNSLSPNFMVTKIHHEEDEGSDTNSEIVQDIHHGLNIIQDSPHTAPTGIYVNSITLIYILFFLLVIIAGLIYYMILGTGRMPVAHATNITQGGSRFVDLATGGYNESNYKPQFSAFDIALARMRNV